MSKTRYKEAGKGINLSHAMFRYLGANKHRLVQATELADFLWPGTYTTQQQKCHRISCAIPRANDWAASKGYTWSVATVLNNGYILVDETQKNAPPVTPAPWTSEEDETESPPADDGGPSWP